MELFVKKKAKKAQVDKPLQSPGDSSIKKTREEGGGARRKFFFPLRVTNSKIIHQLAPSFFLIAIKTIISNNFFLYN